MGFVMTQTVSIAFFALIRARWDLKLIEEKIADGAQGLIETRGVLICRVERYARHYESLLDLSTFDIN